MSYDEAVDSHLSAFVQMFTSIAAVSGKVKKAMSAYVQYNMRNYIMLPDEERTTERFSCITDAACGLNDSDVNNILFLKYDWLREWLYDHDDDTQEKRKTRKENRQALIVSLRGTDNKLPYFEYLERLRKWNCLDGTVLHDIIAVEQLVTPSVGENEAKAIFALNGEFSMLLQTHDTEYIDTNIEGSSFAALSNGRKVKLGRLMSQSGDRRMLYILVSKYIPLAKMWNDVYDILGAEKIASITEIQDWIIDSKRWKRKADVVREFLRSIPDEYWSDRHKKYVLDAIKKIQGGEVIESLTLQNVCHSDNISIFQCPNTKEAADFLYSTDEFKKKCKGAMVDVYSFFKLNFVSQPLIQGEVSQYNIRDWVPATWKIEDGDTLWLAVPLDFGRMDTFIPKNKVIPYGDRFVMRCKFYKKARLVAIPGNIGENMKFETSYKRKLRKKELSPKKLFNKYAQYLSNSQLSSIYGDNLVGVPNDAIAESYMWGYVPERLLKEHGEYQKGLVIKADGFNVEIVTRNNKRPIQREVIRYGTLSVGDIVYKVPGEKTFLKIHTSERSGRTGFEKGRVSTVYPDKLIISPKNGGESFIAYNVEGIFHHGTRVTFFPTAIIDEYNNIPKAYGVVRMDK